MSYAFRCEVCDGPPRWRMDRHGDAVVSWACGFHVNAVLERLQRTGEVTQVTVRRRSEIAEQAAHKLTEYTAIDGGDRG